MKCMGCGRQIPDNSKFCSHCGHGIPGPEGTVQHLAAQPTAKSGMSVALIAVLVIVVAVVVLGIIAAYFYYSQVHSPFTADLSYDASSWFAIWGGGSGMEVEVWGNIYNHGSEDAIAIVHLRVFDGYSWHKYDVNAGLVPGNGFRHFEWSINYDSGDENSVNVQYTISRG